jgi:DNA topoisomerase-3
MKKKIAQRSFRIVQIGLFSHTDTKYLLSLSSSERVQVASAAGCKTMSVVIIAEKPSVANDIAKVLGATSKSDTHWQGNDIIVTWAIGHLLQLKYMDDYDEAFKDWRKTIDRLPYIPETFEYKPIGGRGKKQLSAINKLIKSKDVEEIVNACDAAREGELIFRTIVKHSKTKTKTSRMWLQSMTKDSIQQAWEGRASGEEYNALRDAAYSRSEADWIIGMNGSRVANSFLPRKKNERSAISLGRVQTATLAMIVSHELEVLSHIPLPYWQLEANFKSESAEWIGRWERQNHIDDPEQPDYKPHRIIEKSEYERLLAILESGKNASIKQTQRDSKERAPLNFDLTTLQREANSTFGWSAKRTLGIAQDLYDTHKLTTYPRTDSRHLPEDMHEEIAKIIRQLGAQDDYNPHSTRIVDEGMKNAGRNFNNAKVSDHFAIIPTGKIPDVKMSADHSRLYDLIVRTFLASWHPEAIWDVQKRTATIDGEHFSKEARQIKSEGWRAVRPKKQSLPEGWNSLPSNPCQGSVESFEFKEEQSKPKGRLKEAGLLRLMEHAGKQVDDEELADAMKDKGLGTPATRADTIEKLIDRGYIQRARGGSISATAHGIRIIDVLKKIPVEWITSAEMTGEMEASLLRVQRGDEPRENYMNDVIEQTRVMVERIKNHDRTELYANEPSIGECSVCSGAIIETTLNYQCEKNEGKDKGCPFVFWKDTSGRWFDQSTAKRLLSEGEIENLHGFFNRSGETYTATVKISKEGKVEFVGGGESSSDASDEEICSCPSCDHGTIRIGQTMYACDNDDCKFRGVSKEMCKRPITVDEAKHILQNGKSELLDDFISRRGRPFKAYLVMDKTRIKFEFPPREAAADATRFTVVEGVVAVCPVHNVNIIETETHYQPEPGSTGSSLQIAREISKREITREEAKTLIEKREIGPFDDFLSKKTGRPFSAILYLKKNESIGYRFAKR